MGLQLQGHCGKYCAKHGNADALSRCPCLVDNCKHCSNLEAKKQSSDDVSPVDDDSATESVPKPVRRVSWQAMPLWSNEQLQKAQLEGDTIGPIAKLLKKSGVIPPWSSIAPQTKATKMYWAQ